MTSNLITIRTYTSPHEAHLPRGVLQAEGILAFLQDENVISLDWLYSDAIGGIKLQVAQADAARALETLATATEAAPSLLDATSGTDPCPACAQPMLELVLRRRRLPYLLLLFLNFPVVKPWPLLKCAACGTEQIYRGPDPANADSGPLAEAV